MNFMLREASYRVDVVIAKTHAPGLGRKGRVGSGSCDEGGFGFLRWPEGCFLGVFLLVMALINITDESRPRLTRDQTNIPQPQPWSYCRPHGRES